MMKETETITKVQMGEKKKSSCLKQESGSSGHMLVSTTHNIAY